MRTDRPGIAPIVSVVIPTYNRPDYLRLALRSVQDQTFKDIEVIVQDNDSKDDISAVVAEFPNLAIRFYRNERNIGQTANVTTAIRRATGTYLAILADDDCWRSEFLARLVAALEARPDCVVAFANFDLIDKDGNVLIQMTQKGLRYQGSHLIARGYHDSFEYIATIYRALTVISGSVLRRGVADWSDVPTNLSVGIDTYIAFLTTRCSGSCFFDDAHLYEIRMHPGSVTTAGLTTVDDILTKHRSYILLWDTMLRDRTSRLKAYYRMKRSWSALALIANQIRYRRWRLHEIISDLRAVDIRMPFYVLCYLVRFKYIGLDRRFVP
jgi:glycosyltransferase involved in cell wall biosynthesis